MQTSQIYTEDGHQFELTFFGYSLAEDLPVLLILPAMGVTAKYYNQLCEEIRQHRITVAVLDHRGIG